MAALVIAGAWYLALVPRLLCVLLALSACTPGPRDFDPFAVQVDLTAGPIMLEVSDGPDGTRVPAVVDTLAPVSVLDSFQPGIPLVEPRRRRIDLQLYDAPGSVARALFQDATVVDMHPCAGTGPDTACRVGNSDAPRDVAGIVGTDLLGRGALRVDFGASTMAFFPDIAGDDAARGRACEAVLSNPFAGGGTLLISGAEIGYSGRRTALGVCAAFSPDATSAVDRGVDLLLVVSTGIGPSVLTEAAYERYRAYCRTRSCDEPAAASALPETLLRVPSGPITGRLGTIDAIALVGEGSTERGPCQELHANHVLSRDGCRSVGGTPPEITSCPCTDGKTFCSTAAAVELSIPIQVVVLPDDAALLQALRFELRPGLPEVDGILGTAALAKLALDFDYPNDRVVGRCTDDVDCLARPAVRSRAALDEIKACPNLP